MGAWWQDLHHQGELHLRCWKAALPASFSSALSSSGENTRRAARPGCDKRLDCGSRIVARHDRTDHFQGGPIGGGHAPPLPKAEGGLHSLASLCWTRSQPGVESVCFPV